MSAYHISLVLILISLVFLLISIVFHVLAYIFRNNGNDEAMK